MANNKRPAARGWHPMSPPSERPIARRDRDPIASTHDSGRGFSPGPSHYSSSAPSLYGRGDHWTPYDRKPANPRSNRAFVDHRNRSQDKREQQPNYAQDERRSREQQPNYAQDERYSRREDNRELARTDHAIDSASRTDYRRGEQPMRSTQADQAFLSDPSRVMPKNFLTPLTCFYWANIGRCSKSEQDCWYAHHWTGVIAAAPVRLGTGGPVAGREAEKAVYSMSERETAMRQREAVLTANEDAFKNREYDLSLKESAAAQNESSFEANMQEMNVALNAVEDSGGEATRALERRRTELINILSQSTEQVLSTQATHGVGSAVDGALEALAVLKVKVDAIAHRLRNNLGTANRNNFGHVNDHQAMAGTGEEEEKEKIKEPTPDDFEDNLP